MENDTKHMMRQMMDTEQPI